MHVSVSLLLGMLECDGSVITSCFVLLQVANGDINVDVVRKGNEAVLRFTVVPV